MSEWNVNGKTVIVTGANSGIGKETARALAMRGAKVVMVCRSLDRGNEAKADISESAPEATIDLMQCDMASFDSIRSFAAEFERTYDQLDVLVNNAGAMFAKKTFTDDGYETTFAVNHLAYFLITNLLLDMLQRDAPARIVNVASTGHRFGFFNLGNLQGEKFWNEWTAYGTSKLCNIAFTYELARRLEGTGVTVNCLHPGAVGSSFGSSAGGMFQGLMNVGRRFLLTPEQGARTSIYLATQPDLGRVTGKYFTKCKPVKSSRATHDRDKQARLWSLSEQMTGLG